MTEETKLFKAPCEDCGQQKLHKILCESVSRGDHEYDFASFHSVIQCQGCNNKSFRHLFQDIESAYRISDDDYEVPERITYYPKPDIGPAGLDLLFVAPDLVREIYEESLLAVREDALTLAGLGLRGTIEAVCNDLNVTGKNLEVRIGSLEKQGLISKKDAERLHAIRFLGNDAAHEIKKPKKAQIVVALKIIDHLLQSVYLLELEAQGKLETIISNVGELKSVLEKNLKDASPGHEAPIPELLSKDARRLGGELARLEPELIQEIQRGEYKKLSIGKVTIASKSKANIQHFIVR